MLGSPIKSNFWSRLESNVVVSEPWNSHLGNNRIQNRMAYTGTILVHSSSGVDIVADVFDFDLLNTQKASKRFSSDFCYLDPSQHSCIRQMC